MSSSSWSVNPSFSLPPDIGFSLDDVAMFVPPMAISVRILLFVVVVVLYPLLRHLIPFLVLCVSGLLTNLIQMVCFICVWPISEVAYTRINSAVKKFDWFVLVCLIDRFAGVKVSVYTDQATIRLMSEGHVLFISNDRADADHLYDLVLAQWSGCLGTLLTVIKTSAKFIRSKILHRNDIPQPFWISLFLERTGLEHGEFVAAQKLPSSVSSDHCKDMVYAVRHMRSVVPAIYDIHVAIRKALPSPTLKSLFKEGPSVEFLRLVFGGSFPLVTTNVACHLGM